MVYASPDRFNKNFRAGVQVQIHGLPVEEEELNGRCAVSLGPDEVNPSLIMLRLKEGKEVALKRANLRFTGEAGMLPVGSVVILTGLQKDTELNGRQAMVCDWRSGRVDPDRHRILIDFGYNEKSVKLENLVLREEDVGETGWLPRPSINRTLSSDDEEEMNEDAGLDGDQQVTRDSEDPRYDHEAVSEEVPLSQTPLPLPVPIPWLQVPASADAPFSSEDAENNVREAAVDLLESAAFAKLGMPSTLQDGVGTSKLGATPTPQRKNSQSPGRKPRSPLVPKNPPRSPPRSSLRGADQSTSPNGQWPEDNDYPIGDCGHDAGLTPDRQIKTFSNSMPAENAVAANPEAGMETCISQNMYPSCPNSARTVMSARGTLRPKLIIHEGFISAGDDILTEKTTVAAAREKCLLLPGCKGFSFEGSPNDPGIKRIFFKKKWDCQTSLQGKVWHSYQLVMESAYKETPLLLPSKSVGNISTSSSRAHLEPPSTPTHSEAGSEAGAMTSSVPRMTLPSPMAGVFPRTNLSTQTSFPSRSDYVTQSERRYTVTTTRYLDERGNVIQEKVTSSAANTSSRCSNVAQAGGGTSTLLSSGSINLGALGGRTDGFITATRQRPGYTDRDIRPGYTDLSSSMVEPQSSATQRLSGPIDLTSTLVDSPSFSVLQQAGLVSPRPSRTSSFAVDDCPGIRVPRTSSFAADDCLGVRVPRTSSFAADDCPGVRSQLPTGAQNFAGLSSVSVSGCAGVRVSELHIGARFDPRDQAVLSMLCARLNLPGATVEELKGVVGGCNKGIWVMRRQGRNECVLKLVSNKKSHYLLSEAENFVRNAKEFPDICTDRSLAFPVQIFNCVEPNGQRNHDVVAMPMAAGQQLTLALAMRKHNGRMQDCCKMLHWVGAAAARFHRKYKGSQLGDFQGSNVFVDEPNEHVTFIDLGGMRASDACLESDVTHFMKGLRLICNAWGEQAYIECARSFELGYNSVT